jgi:hypothetical protein
MIRTSPRIGKQQMTQDEFKRWLAGRGIEEVSAAQRAQQKLYRETYRTIADALQPADPAKVADLIIAAGARRRGELKEPPQFSDDASGRLARSICNAGRRARGKPELK